MNSSKFVMAIRRLGALALLGATCGAALPQSASAQFFFRPFGGAHFGPAQGGPLPIASRRAAAIILQREGYRLVGPIERRGPRIVAHGIGPRGEATRFFIDAYDGSIVSSWDEAPPAMDPAMGPRSLARSEPADGGEPRVIEAPREAMGAAPARSARRSSTPRPLSPPPKVAVAPPANATAPAIPPASAPKPDPAASQPAAPRATPQANAPWSSHRAVAPPRPDKPSAAAPAQAADAKNAATVAPAPAAPILPPAPKVSPILGAGAPAGAGG